MRKGGKRSFPEDCLGEVRKPSGRTRTAANRKIKVQKLCGGGCLPSLVTLLLFFGIGNSAGKNSTNIARNYSEENRF